MIFVRKRLLIWLIRAYIRRLWKRILIFFFIGIIIFFSILKIGKIFISRFPIGEKESIGIMGSYTMDNLPLIVLSDLSYGLTNISSNGIPIPGLASSWKIDNNEKNYTFFLKKNILFSDGQKLKSRLINYSFKDVDVQNPNDSTIVFKLKESYSPFLVTVSKPIFKNNFIGIGNYEIKNILLNGYFVESIIIASIKNNYKIKMYRFYPTEEALKLAFISGEVNKILGISNINYKNTSFNLYPNLNVEKKVDYKMLVTLFFNTKDSILSDPKIRNGLSYAIPKEFLDGERAYSPFPQSLWAFSFGNEKQIDIEHAKILINASSMGGMNKPSLVIKTLSKYKKSTDEIVKTWNKIGISTKIEIVDSVPSVFQIFIGDFIMPKDPDQYALWHTKQINNITNYDNPRIDKLLEDGRKITNQDERLKIYSDFQKYLLADPPAIFLYYPFVFDIKRK
ncbi:ABC transporter substrate-binding protein [Candidatus Levyibacteriota bacterium]|nr:ABC transporter substrate-binding protein [Candidatus Levybacteria bacterium]GDX61969.1 ABC transporter substrate-binding protein [Candidatus Levybacteria bacterium]